MSKPLQTALVATLFLGVLGASGAAAQEAGQPPPPPRAIPGVTVPDQFPRGCVDCHVNRPDLGMDVRLSTGMAKWQAEVPAELLAKARASSPAGLQLTGKHPPVEGRLAAIKVPDACLGCHSGSSAPPFGRLLHRLHLAGGEQNHFLTLFQGECTHCHKFDAATGGWSSKSGAEEP